MCLTCYRQCWFHLLPIRCEFHGLEWNLRILLFFIIAQRPFEHENNFSPHEKSNGIAICYRVSKFVSWTREWNIDTLMMMRIRHTDGHVRNFSSVMTVVESNACISIACNHLESQIFDRPPEIIDESEARSSFETSISHFRSILLHVILCIRFFHSGICSEQIQINSENDSQKIKIAAENERK